MPYLKEGTRVRVTNASIEGCDRGELISRDGGYHMILLDNGIPIECYENEIEAIVGDDNPPKHTPLPFDAVEKVRKYRELYINSLLQMIERLDPRHPGYWRFTIHAAMDAGMTTDDLRLELGATLPTIGKWLAGQTQPREGTRRLMRGAITHWIKVKLKEKPVLGVG